MVSNDGFFQRRQAAAVLKHGILKRYPTVFATMTGRYSPGNRVVYVDGYAGPGRYEDGSPGSPLLAVETARLVASWRRDVHCLFVESDPTVYRDLHARLSTEAPADLRWSAWAGDLEQHLDRVLSVAAGVPLLAFLDPFGTALSFDALVRGPLGRPPSLPTEVLLNINLEAVWRIGGLLTGAVRERGSSRTLARLDAFFGGDWWRDAFGAARRARGDEGRAASSAAQDVVAEYRRRIYGATGFRAFTVPIRRRPTHEPLFLLVLFFRSPVAPWKFNEAASKANAEWRAACRDRDDDSGDDGGLFDLAELRDSAARDAEATLEQEWVRQIKRNLLRLLADRQSVALGDHVQAVFGSTLGQAREMHVRRAWNELVATGQVAPRQKGDLSRVAFRRPGR